MVTVFGTPILSVAELDGGSGGEIVREAGDGACVGPGWLGTSTRWET